MAPRTQKVTHTAMMADAIVSFSVGDGIGLGVGDGDCQTQRGLATVGWAL